MKRRGRESASQKDKIVIVDRARRKQLMIVGVALALITLASLFPVLRNDFVNYDDPEYVTGNRNVASGLSPENVAWAFTHFHSSNWHPLTWISHQIDVAVWGLNPMGHHFTNLILHVLNSVLLLSALYLMTGYLWRSAIVAALFAVHPLHVESVAWVSERKDVLSTFFWMLTLIAYHYYADKPEWKRYVLVATAFALGLMSKPMLVTLPLVLLMLDYWPLQRLSRGAVVEKLPLFVMSAASCAVTFAAQSEGGAVKMLREFSVWDRLANAAVSVGSYLLNTVWPTGLAVFYPHPESAISAWLIVSAILFIAIMTVWAFKSAKSRPYLPVGWLWFAVTLLPVIGIVQVGIQAMADRYTYVPLTGVFIAIVWAASDAVSKRPTMLKPAAVFCVTMLAALSVLTHLQAYTWRSSETLFKHAVEVTRGNYIAYASLAAYYKENGDLDKSSENIAKALDIKPDDPESRETYANLLVRMGRNDEAIEQFRSLVSTIRGSASLHSNFGAALAARGDLEEAEKELIAAMDIEPDHAGAYTNLGIVLIRRNRIDEALPILEKAVELDPENMNTVFNLGLAYATLGRRDEAIARFEEILRNDPNDESARNALAALRSR